MGWVWKDRQSWRGAYRDESGKQHTKSFKRQVDAKRWIATEEAKLVRGDWIDPSAGTVTFSAFYANWAPRQVWLSSTGENADLAVAGVTFGVPLEVDPHQRRSGLKAARPSVLLRQRIDRRRLRRRHRATGHASATTTLNTYAHLWPTAEDKTRAAASGMAAAVLATRLPHIKAK